MNERPPEEVSPRRGSRTKDGIPGMVAGLRRRCILAIVVLAAITVSTFVVEGKLARSIASELAGVDSLARQRMHLRRCCQRSEALVGAGPERRATVARELAFAGQELRNELDLLEERLGGPRFEALRRDSEAFLGAVEARAHAASEDEPAAIEALRAIREEQRDGRLLQRQHEHMVQLSEQARAVDEQLEQLDLLHLLASLAALAAVAGLVIRPMLRRTIAETEQAVQTTQQLARHKVELEELSHLEREHEERRRRVLAMANLLEDVEVERRKLRSEVEARARVQEALEASEARLVAVVESAPAALVMIDEAGSILLVNAQALATFGYARDELIGQPVEILLPVAERAAHPDSRRAYFAAPSVRPMGSGRDLRGLRKDGSEFPVEIGLNPVPTTEGPRALAVIVDITQRQAAEQAISSMNLELRRKNDEIQQFVYTVSHDLKSPLVTCRGYVGIMRRSLEEGSTEELPGLLDRMERAAARMGDLIQDLLQLSRIGVIRNEPEEVDVGKLLEEVVAGLDERIRATGAEVEVEAELPAAVADRVRLREVFENYLGNALKYGCDGEDRRIRVGGHREGDELRYFVADRGRGIDPRYHQRIFELFQRLESGGEGTGVGLTAVAKIVEQHRGRVWVESEVGQGSTFWFSLPVDPAPGPAG